MSPTCQLPIIHLLGFSMFCFFFSFVFLCAYICLYRCNHSVCTILQSLYTMHLHYFVNLSTCCPLLPIFHLQLEMKWSSVDLTPLWQLGNQIISSIFDIGDAAMCLYKELSISFELSLRQIPKTEIYGMRNIFVFLHIVLPSCL